MSLLPAASGRAVAVLLAVAILIGLGAAAGVWLAARHYRPLLDDVNGKAVACASARDNLVSLAEEQGKALGDLVLAGKDRQAAAEQAVKTAEVDAKTDYDAANRLQQERTGGDQCEAATSIIDTELGL